MIQAAVLKALISDREPLSKYCPLTGLEPYKVTTTPEVGAAFIPLTSGVEALFGLPSVPVDTHSTGQLVATFPSLLQGVDTSVSQDTPPAPQPKATGPSGTPKSGVLYHANKYHLLIPLPDARRHPAPLSEHRCCLTAHLKSLPPKATPPQQAHDESDAEYSSASEEESVGLTAFREFAHPQIQGSSYPNTEPFI